MVKLISKDRRLSIIAAVMIFLTLIVLARFFYLMVLAEQLPNTTLNNVTVERGPIFDRNGRLLAIQNELDSVAIWTPYLENQEESVALTLSTLLNLDESEVYEKIRNTPKGFIWIKRKISPTESKKVRTSINDGLLPGVMLRTEQARSYPQQELASTIIGHTDIDNRGIAGIEYSFDNELSFDNRLYDDDRAYGHQIYLTIDMDLQYIAEQILETATATYEALWSSMLLFDVESGEFLTYAVKPGYNPNRFNLYSSEERSNYPLIYSFEPGSVFKMFTIASMLELGYTNPGEEFICNGSYEKEWLDQPITCLRPHGKIRADEILKYSCNVSAAKVSERSTNEQFFKILEAFGFTRATGLMLGGEWDGLIRDVDQWSLRSKPTIAFGQELQVSAVQMVAAASVIANKGVLIKPGIVRRIESATGEIINSYERREVDKVISERSATQTLQMMNKSTEPGGTAFRLAIDGISIAAKTGTAQIIDTETNTYSDKDYVASTLAIVPTENPRYIIYVVVHSPKGNAYYGSQIAAPMAGEMIMELARRGKLISSEQQRFVYKQQDDFAALPEVTLPRLEAGSTMPSLLGLAKRDIMPLLAIKDIRFELNGFGRVVNQRPEAGVIINNENPILLELR